MFKRPFYRSAVFWLSLALLAPFLPVLIAPGGRVLGNAACDNPSMFFFINDFAGRCWRQGIVPLWNPHIMLGLPFLGEGQAAIFHPLSFLFILLPAGQAINALIAISVLLTGLFFYGYLRASGLGRPAAAGGALIWCGSNVLVTRIYAGHLTILLDLIEMPLILMLWERYRKSGSTRCLAGLALAYGVMILAAYPQVLFIFSLFFLIYVLMNAVPEYSSRAAAAREGRAILTLGLFVLLGIGIGAVQLLPSADFTAESFRRRVDFNYCKALSFEPANLLTLLAPRIFGYSAEAGPGQYWGEYNYWEMACYIGLLPLALAVMGVAEAPRRRRVVLGSCSLLFFLIALGEHTPLFRLLYDYVPPFNVFRSPSKYLLITELCLITFSAHGLQALLDPAAASRRGFKAAVLTICLLLLLVIGMGAFLIPGSTAPDSRWHMLMSWVRPPGAGPVDLATAGARAAWAAHDLARSACFLTLALGVFILARRTRWHKALAPVLFAVMLADLLTFCLPLLKSYDVAITRLPPQLLEPIQRYPYPARISTSGLWPNLAIRHGFSSPSGYSGNVPLRFSDLVNRLKRRPLSFPEVADPLPFYEQRLRALAIDAVLWPTRQGTVAADPNTELPSLSGWTLTPLANPFPRAWLAAAPRAASNEQEAYDDVYNGMIAAEDSLRDSPIVEEATPPPAAPLAPGETVQFASFAPQRVELRVHAARPRVLALAEMFEKNWTATVGGKAVPVFPVNYLFRGVIVPPGDSAVIYEYRPEAFRRGAWISALSLLVLAAITIQTLRPKHS